MILIFFFFFFFFFFFTHRIECFVRVSVVSYVALILSFYCLFLVSLSVVAASSLCYAS